MIADHSPSFECSLCRTSFSTGHQKEDHLRLHCVICKALLESREALLAHVRDSHSTEAATAVFWDIPPLKGNDDDVTPDERDRDEYVREHLE